MEICGQLLEAELEAFVDGIFWPAFILVGLAFVGMCTLSSWLLSALMCSASVVDRRVFRLLRPVLGQALASRVAGKCGDAVYWVSGRG
jgi:hypothetical protein